MNAKLKYPLMALLVAAGLTSGAVQALQKDITVTADVDPTLELTLANGSALPTQPQSMAYKPGVGLMPLSIPTAIATNDATKGVKIKLGNPAMLSQVNGSKTIPLKVSFGGTVLTTTEANITAAVLGFSNGKSQSKTLLIEQNVPGPVAEAGEYNGTVNLVLVPGT